MVFDTDLPQPFGSPMIWKLETNRAFKLLKLKQRQILWSDSIQYLYFCLHKTAAYTKCVVMKKKKKNQTWEQILIKQYSFWTFLLITYSKTYSHLARPDFDVEVVPLVRDLEDLRPCKSVDPQPVSVDEQATRTNSQHDLYTLRVLATHTHTHKNCLSILC